MTLATPPSTVTTSRPRYEGANIRTWIGFKHFLYLVEEALLDWFRTHTPGTRALYHEHGLGLEIVDVSALLPATLEVDDEVRASVTPVRPGRFTVTLHVVRDGREVLALRGKVTVALVREADPPARRPLDGVRGAALLPPSVDPEALAGDPVAAGDSGAAGAAPADAASEEAGPPAGGFGWSWRVPYFYCHFSDRLQHSGHVRALEEVVDRFLADRGISVGRMLAERGWIPVVSRVRVRMLAAAHLEEVVRTSFTVDDILRGSMFDGRMDCTVRRGEKTVHVATARILHGYAISRGPDAGGIAALTPDVVAALTGDVAPAGDTAPAGDAAPAGGADATGDAAPAGGGAR